MTDNLRIENEASGEDGKETGLTRRDRLIAVGIVWVLFGFMSTFVYAAYVHDVGATFWALWTLVLPVVLPLVWLFDLVVSEFFEKGKSQGKIFALDTMFALAFWIVPW